MLLWRDMLEMGMYAAIAPLVLLLLSSVWIYPAVLEEVVKWGILRTQILDARLQILGGLVVGLVFGLSEAILFATNAWSVSQWVTIGMRLMFTVPMHMVTGMIIAWGMRNRMGWLGLALAMGVHAGFNLLAR